MKAKVLYNLHGGPGEAARMILCSCGHQNLIYSWSWAGNGKARCRKCRKWIWYPTLEVGSRKP